MPWVRIDDHFDEHPKMQRVGPLGWGVWLAGLAYCNRNLTDGFIPWSKARTMCSFEVVEEDGLIWELSRTSGMSGDDINAQWVIGLLIEAGLWEEVSNGKGRIDGYRIHDYDEYQPTKDVIDSEREAKRRAGQAGGKASAEARAQAPASSKSEQVLEQNVTGCSTESQAESNPVPNPVPVPQELNVSSLHRELALRLAKRMTENNPKRKPTTDSRLTSWANTVRLMMERDNRTSDEVTQVIDWCQSDSFWKTTILSMEKLREQWDQLWLKMSTPVPIRPSPNGDKPFVKPNYLQPLPEYLRG